MTSSEKNMFSIYFICQRFVSIEAFPKRERFNSVFFTLIIRLSIIGNVVVLRSKMRAQGYWQHIDNAKFHNAALSFRKTEEAEPTRLPQPLHSPDLTHCDFF
jgi:hypothetical protein